jgi:ankyrin repeat protein
MKNFLGIAILTTSFLTLAEARTPNVCDLNKDIDMYEVNIPENERMVNKFIAAGGNINDFCNERTPLMALAESSWASDIRINEILNAGAKIDLKNSKGETALSLSKSDKVFYALLERGANVVDLVIDGRPFIEVLFERGMHNSDLTALYKAIFALASGFHTKEESSKEYWDFNWKKLQGLKYTILNYKGNFGNEYIANLAVTAAVVEGDKNTKIKNKIIPAIINLGANLRVVDTFEHTPLHECAGHPILMEQLLKAGLKAEINAQNINGDTALIMTTKYSYKVSKNAEERLAAVKVLLKYKADITIKDKEGKTALDYELRRDDKSEEIIKLLK